MARWILLAALLLPGALPDLAAQPAPVDPLFQRGNFNADADFDIADPVFTLVYLFLGEGAPGCLDAGDANDDGKLDLGDAMHSLEALFLGGPPPASPYPECGQDSTEDLLGCGSFPACPDAINRIVAIRTIPGGIEIEVFSSRPFPARALFPILCLTRTESFMSQIPAGGDEHSLVFVFSEDQFAVARNGDPVTVQYGDCAEEFESRRLYWDLWIFGPLDKSILDR